MTSFQCEQLALFHNNQFYTSLNAVFLFFFPAYVLLGYNRDDFKNSLQGIKPEFCNLVGVFQSKRGSLEASSCVGSQVWYKSYFGCKDACRVLPYYLLQFRNWNTLL